MKMNTTAKTLAQRLPRRLCIQLLTLGLGTAYVILFTLSAHAETVSNTVSLDGVTRIHHNGSSDLYITQGDEEFVRITSEREVLERVDARVKGKTLYLARKETRRLFGLGSDSHVRFDVQLRQIEQVRNNGSGKTHTGDLDVERLKIDQSGSGDIEMKSIRTGELTLRLSGSGEISSGTIETKDMELRLAGSGEVSLPEVVADELDIRVAGSGDIDLDNLQARVLDVAIAGSADFRIAGRVQKQRLEISGSGDYAAADLISEIAEIEVHGSGEVVVNVQRRLTTELTRGVDVIYHGGPDLEIDASGRGQVRPAN